MAQLTDQTIIITGSARGIGAELARGMAARGANVVVSDIRGTDGTVSSIVDAGGTAVGVEADVTSNDDLAALVAKANADLGPVTGLVNNAGIFADLDVKPFMEITEDEFDKVLTVNLRGMFQAVKSVVPTMQEQQGGGSIVNVSSGTFFYGAPGMLAYVASKSAVVGMTRSMARELAAHGIRVNAIAPGFTESDSVLEAGSFEMAREPSKTQRMIQRAMIPEDLTGTVAFLLSADSNFITGQLFNVDGGKTTY